VAYSTTVDWSPLVEIHIPDNLTTDDAPVQLTESLHMAKAEEVLRRWQGNKKPEEMVEVAKQPRLKAEVEAECFLATAQLGECAERALTYQAIQMAENGFYHYLPGEPDTIEEHLHQLLDQADAGTTNAYRLKKLVTVILPYLKSHGMAEQVNRLWQKDTVAKTCTFVDRVGHLFTGSSIDGGSEEPMAPQTFQLVQDMLGDLCNPDVGVSMYGEKYPSPTPRSGMSTIEVYNYLNGSGSILVLLCPERSQVAYVEHVLRKKAEWKAGEGRETFLPGLIAQKGVA